ncbi:hypothetical protein LSM04_000347 [Trypanosoma melophagium]|uniref:uncharacterized protein n=1 Tax=Trypanosoma melophagium TaxID=715481 RepID=UPI00351A3DC3|nr:hypothetical protein LSM04_000347 [Trypanosoma melophagium]
MHKSTLPGTLFVAFSVLLLGLLLSSSLAPIARRECDGSNLFVFGFLVEYEKSVYTGGSNNSTSLQIRLLPYKIAKNMKEKPLVRHYISDFPEGALRTCMILYITLTCLCALFALVSITTVVVDATTHLVIWNSFSYFRLFLLLGLTSVFLGRFVVVVVMAKRSQLYSGIGNECFAQTSGEVFMHSGFFVSLASLCISILAAVTLWNTRFH